MLINYLLKKKKKKKRKTWKRCSKNSLTEQQQRFPPFFRCQSFESFESPRSRCHCILVAIKDLGAIQRFQHSVLYLSIGENSSNSFLVGGQSTEHLRDPLFPGDSYHVLAEIPEETPFLGSDGLQRAQSFVKPLRFRHRWRWIDTPAWSIAVKRHRHGSVLSGKRDFVLSNRIILDELDPAISVSK